MGKKAIFPGSFDPFTRGHEAVVRSAVKFFDHVIVGIGINSKKQYLFSMEDRLKFIESVFEGEENWEHQGKRMCQRKETKETH